MTRFHIQFKKNVSNINVPDLFKTRIDARHFIETWNLEKYEPEIIEISEERYLQAIKARLDLGAYEAHKEHLRDFGRQVDEQRYDFNDAMKSIAKSVESLSKTKWGEAVNKQEYDLTDDGTGKKYDTGKSMVGTLSRVFSRALLGVGTCIEFGTRKYPKPDNWKLVEGAFERYQDSMMRHYLKFLSGEERDSETNILHLCHMTWNALAITELYLMNHPEYDKELFK